MKFDTPATTNPIDQLKVVGRPTPRIDGPLKTTGTARYAYERHDAVPEAAYGVVVGAGIAKGRIATVAVNQFVFQQPVSIGDLLSFYAKVERVGTTSITVHVEVYAERNPADMQVVKVTEANLTYVAIDMDGKPRAIPKG